MQLTQESDSLAYSRLKHWSRLLVYPQYRDHQRKITRLKKEFSRLKSLPRYEPTVTDIIGTPIEIVDAASFLWTYPEIFEQQIYRFRANGEKPYILDGGANIGLSVLYFKKLYPKSEIVAFEADDKIFSVLQRNVEKSEYRDIKLIRRALWSSETSLSFMSEGSDGGRIAQINDPKSVIVPTVRLRNYLDRAVDFLKLDIEGAETEVLLDCSDLLCNVENLFVEYHSFVDRPQTLHTLVNILANAGFRVHINPRAASPQPFVCRRVFLGIDLNLDIFAFRS